MLGEPLIETVDRVDIIAMARSNQAFRRVIDTGHHQQVVVMTLPPGGAIGLEVHPDIDQVFLVAEGEAEAIVGDRSLSIREHDLVFVTAGTRHDIVNRAATPLRLITIYAPPAHAPGTVHRTREEADAAEG
jgi:mannose-6-phosphate isomerase-like protein (cupin superfamily)